MGVLKWSEFHVGIEHVHAALAVYVSVVIAGTGDNFETHQVLLITAIGVCFVEFQLTSSACVDILR